MNDFLEDDDGVDVPMIPIENVRCCFKWVDNKQEFYPLEKARYGHNDPQEGWRCSHCGVWYT